MDPLDPWPRPSDRMVCFSQKHCKVKSWHLRIRELVDLSTIQTRLYLDEDKFSLCVGTLHGVLSLLAEVLEDCGCNEHQGEIVAKLGVLPNDATEAAGGSQVSGCVPQAGPLGGRSS